MPAIQEAKRKYSPLSRSLSQDNMTVEISIFRDPAASDGWMLEASDNEGEVVSWDETFATDEEALDEFISMVAENGLRDVMNPSDEGTP